MAALDNPSGNAGRAPDDGVGGFLDILSQVPEGADGVARGGFLLYVCRIGNAVESDVSVGCAHPTTVATFTLQSAYALRASMMQAWSGAHVAITLHSRLRDQDAGVPADTCAGGHRMAWPEKCVGCTIVQWSEMLRHIAI
eukprot:1054293-Amphidinium_carterae.1